MLVHLGLGSNLGDRTVLSRNARKALAEQLGEFRKTPIYESAPLLGMEQPSYLNQVVCGTTTLEPLALLHLCQTLEEQAGRVRTEYWGTRTLDIDVLSYGEEMLCLPELTVPHPELAKRAFVLLPLKQLTPVWTHPGTGQTLDELWAQWQTCSTEPLPTQISA